MGIDQIDTALNEGLETADVEVEIARQNAAAMERFIELLDLADEFCRTERLLSLSRDEEQYRFQHWYFGEFVRQGRDEQPRRLGRGPFLRLVLQRFVTPAPGLWAAVAVGGAVGASRWASASGRPTAPASRGPPSPSTSWAACCWPDCRPSRSSAATTWWPSGWGPVCWAASRRCRPRRSRRAHSWPAGRLALAAAYVGGTLAAALLAVTVADHWSRPAEQQLFADEDGDR